MSLKELPINRIFWVIGIIWSLILLLSLGWSTISERKEAIASAKAAVFAYSDSIVTFRSWVASHHGVYVPVTKQTPPNPYLTEVKIEERDLNTPSGRQLTLMNPAYMTIQLNKLFSNELGIHSNLSSLNPLNKNNQPDEWERAALLAFEKGATEQHEINIINSEPYMRLIRPLYVSKPCLQCHAKQGYKVGDVRGGFSTSVPLKKHWAIMEGHLRNVIITQGLIWLIGLIAIIWTRNRFSNYQKQIVSVHKQVVESEARLSEAQKIAHLGNWEWDINNNDLYWSDEIYRIFGLAPQQFEANYDAFLATIHPDDRKRVASRIEEAVANNGLYQATHRVVLPNNDERVVNEQGKVFYNNQDQAIRMVGTAHDVTKAHKDAEKLRLAATAFEVQEGIVITDSDANILKVNQTFSKTTGYTEAEVIGKNPKILQSGQHNRAFYIALWQKLLETGSWEGEIWNRSKEGRIYPEWLHISAVKNEANKITHYVGSFVELTERKAQEKALEHANRTQQVIGELLELSLMQTSIKDYLQQSLQKLVKAELPELSIKHAAIFLTTAYIWPRQKAATHCELPATGVLAKTTQLC